MLKLSKLLSGCPKSLQINNVGGVDCGSCGKTKAITEVFSVFCVCYWEGEVKNGIQWF